MAIVTYVIDHGDESAAKTINAIVKYSRIVSVTDGDLRDKCEQFSDLIAAINNDTTDPEVIVTIAEWLKDM